VVLLVAVGPSALTRLSQMLAAARPSMRVHVELSTFAEQSTVRQVIEHVVRHADSLGLNEQELPAVRRHLVNWHGTGDELLTSHGAEDSRPSLASMLDDARTTFRLLRHMTIDEQRHFSRLHVHTLAFQVSAHAGIPHQCACVCLYSVHMQTHLTSVPVCVRTRCTCRHTTPVCLCVSVLCAHADIPHQ